MSIDLFPLLAPLAARMRWEATEIVRDVGERPHLFVRLRLSGPAFPERAGDPYVSVGKVKARLVEIEPGGVAARAYFDRPLPDGGIIEYGYDDAGPWYRFPEPWEAGPQRLTRLDRARLPKNLVTPDPPVG